jgi:hypothetical protein
MIGEDKKCVYLQNTMQQGIHAPKEKKYEQSRGGVAPEHGRQRSIDSRVALGPLP